jgi:hypothetical protein
MIRAAATYLDAVADKRSAITFDTFEMFDYPYRSEFDLTAPGEDKLFLISTPPSARAFRVKPDGQVGFGLSVDRVYVVREPLAWKGN